jgi:hypothetical protein
MGDVGGGDGIGAVDPATSIDALVASEETNPTAGVDASAGSHTPVTDLEVKQAADILMEVMAMQAKERRADATMVKHP